MISNNAPSSSSQGNKVSIFEHNLSTVKKNPHNIWCSADYLNGKNSKGKHANRMQLKGRQQKEGR